MSTPAEDREPSIENAAKQIAQSLTDVFSGLFDYEGHSNRDRNYWQKGPGTDNTETWKHKYERAIDARDAARRERDELQAYLEKIRKPIVESDIQASARQYLRDMYVDPGKPYIEQGQQGRAVLTVLDDLEMWKGAYVESLEKVARIEDERDKWKSRHRELKEQQERFTEVVDTVETHVNKVTGRTLPLLDGVETLISEQARYKAERDDAMALAANRVEEVRRLQAECKASTQLLNEQSEAIRKAAPKPVGLSEQLQRLDKVITDQIEAVGSGSTLAKAANIRRLQARDYDLAHDQARGWSVLAQAATGLQMRREDYWPRAGVDQYRKLAALPLSDRLAHAAALLCAAGDVAKAEGR